MPCSNDDFVELVDQLPEVTPVEGSTYTALKVRGKGFGYQWPLTRTAGLKQERRSRSPWSPNGPTCSRPSSSPVSSAGSSCTSSGSSAAELAELVFEAWRLTAPVRLASA